MMQLQAEISKIYFFSLRPDADILLYSFPGVETEVVDKFRFLNDNSLSFPMFEKMKAGYEIPGLKCMTALAIFGTYRRAKAIIWQAGGNRRLELPTFTLKPKDDSLFSNAAVRGMEELGLGDIICDYQVYGYMASTQRIIAVYSAVVDTFKAKGKKITILHNGTEYDTDFYRVFTFPEMVEEIKTKPGLFDPTSAVIAYAIAQQKILE